MMKLPRRLPYEIAIVASLMLGSCDNTPKSEFTVAQRDEIRDLAREATSDDRQRLAEVEDKLHIDSGGDSD